jgi:serine/threonine-protein kinase
MNPYKTPEAPLEVQAVDEPDEKVAKKIKHAWIAGLISGSITLVFVFLALSGNGVAGIDAWALVDAVAILGLTYGVYRKSRACAVLLFAFFLANKLMMWSAAGSAGTAASAPLALVFLYYFGQGIAGTFQYHKAKEG